MWFVLHLRDALKFLQQLALAFGQLGGRLDPDFDKQITFAVPIQHGNPFAAQLKYGSRLRAFGNLQGLFSFKGWNLDLGSNGRLSERNRHYTIQIITLAIKECVLLDTKYKVHISWRAAVDAGFSDSGKANAGPVFDSGRDLCVNCFLLDDAAFTPAIRARIADHAACPVARGAGASNAEKALLISDLSAAAAGAATGGSLALCAARAVTFFAKLMLSVGNLFFYAEGCLFEFNSDVFPQIGAPLRTSTTCGTTSAEEIAEPEELAKDVAKILEDGCVESATSCGRTYAGMTEAIVHFALLGIRQHGISLTALLEFFFRVRIVGVAVGMELQRELAVGALYLLIGRPTLHTQNFVVISFYARQLAL